MHRKIPKSAFFLLPLGLVAISFASIFIKLCDAPVLTIAVYPLTLVSLFFIGVCKVKHRTILAAFSRKHLGLAKYALYCLVLPKKRYICRARALSRAVSMRNPPKAGK